MKPSSLWFNLSLRARLGLASGGITLLLATLLGKAAGDLAQHRIQQSIGQNLSETAYYMADKLSQGMFERYRELQIITELDPLKRSTNVLEQQQLLEKLQTSYSAYSWIGFTDADGIVRASTQGLLQGQDVAERPWFIGGREGPFVGDVHEAVLLAKLLPNPSNEPLRFVDISFPIFDAQGTFRGVLGAHLNWAWAEEVEASLLQVALDDDTKEILILESNRTILLGPDGLKNQPLDLASVTSAQSGQHGYQIEQWPDSNTYLTGFAPSLGYEDYPGLGWVILVRQDIDDAFIAANKLYQQILLGGCLAGVIFAVLGWLAAGRITEPLHKISVAAEQIRQGDTHVNIPVLKGQNEIAKLSQVLRQLVSSLLQREQQLRFSEEKFRQIAENIHDVFWVFSLERSNWLYVSSAYEEIFGQPSQDLPQDTTAWLQLVHPDDMPSVAAAMPRKYQGDFDQQYRIVRPDGVLRWIRDRAFPVYDESGTLYRVVGLLQDITEQKQAEEVQQQLIKEREANELKSRFIAIASHEFRTPLTVINTSSELLEKFGSGITEDKRQAYFARIRSAIKHLIQVLDEILLAGKLEAGKFQLNLEPANLVQICREIVDDMQDSLGAHHEFVLTYEREDMEADVDTVLLKCALANLVSNAIKYSPNGGMVEIDLGCHQDIAIFTVKDSGIGIPEAEQAKLFASFYRGSNANKIQGTGLGLVLVKEVVALHQGTLAVASQLNQGTTFTISIPLHPLV